MACAGKGSSVNFAPFQQIMEERHKDIISYFQIQPMTTADALLSKHLITGEIYDKLLVPDSDINKARLLAVSVKKRVLTNPMNLFTSFLEVLKMDELMTELAVKLEASVHFTESRTSFTEEEDYIPDISSEVTQSKQSKESYELHNGVESSPDEGREPPLLRELPLLTVLQHPSSCTLNKGSSVTLNFKVASSTTESVAYQWHLDGTRLEGATKCELVRDNITQDHFGFYHCEARVGNDVMVSSDIAIVRQYQQQEVASGISPGDIKVKDSKKGSAEKNTEKKKAKTNKVTVVVAGMPGSGKSTAMNNVFGCSLEDVRPTLSASKVTSISECTRSIKARDLKDKKEKEGEFTLQIIDTPGLAANIPNEVIIKELQDCVAGKEYTLLYCFSVAPGNVVQEIDKVIMRNLYRSLGKEVWSKCIILLTFSDHAQSKFDESEQYVKYIKRCTFEFQSCIQSTGVDFPNIRTVFDKNISTGIIAVPVKKKRQNSEDILPGFEDDDWTDVVFIELIKLSDKENFELLISLKDYNLVLDLGVAGTGASLGGSIGAAIGILGGPPGMVLGTAVGTVAGGVTSFTIRRIARLVKLIQNK